MLMNSAQYRFGQYRFTKSVVFNKRSFWVSFIDITYFKECGFVQYANNLRVHKAKQLLLNHKPMPSLGYFVNKKVGIKKKTKPTQYITFKTDITKLGLVFLISNFFKENFPGKELVLGKKYHLDLICLYSLYCDLLIN